MSSWGRARVSRDDCLQLATPAPVNGSAPPPKETDINTELTLTYSGRTFTIRAISDDFGNWTEAIAETIRDGETAEWDGSGIVYTHANECLADAVRAVLDTVDDDEDGTR